MITNNTTYTSIKSLALAQDIPIAHVKACKLLNAPGCDSSNRYHWNILGPWYTANKSKVEEYLSKEKISKDDNGEWKKRKERAQALIAEIELKEMQCKSLDKDKVIALIKSIASSQSIMLRNLSDTLPHKLLGQDINKIQSILRDEYNNVCQLFQRPLDEWTKKE